MIERVISHPAGRFIRCRTCGSEPRHILAAGRSSKEPVQFIGCTSRHSLQCRCGASTSRHTAISGAETEWGTDYAQLQLTFRQPRIRRVGAA